MACFVAVCGSVDEQLGAMQNASKASLLVPKLSLRILHPQLLSSCCLILCTELQEERHTLLL